MIRTIWLSIENMAEWGVMTASRHVAAAEIAQIVSDANLQPANGTRPALYNAEAAREAWEAVFGRSVHHRDVDPDSRASQDRERLPAKQVKQVKQRPVVMGTCEVCGREFVREYRASGHVTHRKTCDDACRAVLLTRNAKASRTNAFNVSLVPSQKVLAGE